MINLKEKDIIEYNLKISQFKSQAEQKNNIEQQESNIIKCPYCHSIDTKKITNTSKVVHTALFGVFSVSRNSKIFIATNVIQIFNFGYHILSKIEEYYN